MSPEFSIAETDSFQKKIQSRDFSHLQSKIVNYVYPLLKKNPFFGPNIKSLMGKFKGIYRYRIGQYRLFYTIDKAELIVIFIDVELRNKAYK